MSHNLENNKIISAILVAGIVACLCGFVAKHVVSSPPLEKSVLDIDTSALETAGSGDAAPAGPEPILALLAKADATKGEALAKACLACHDFSKGGPNKTGPNLYGIVNNKQAHKDDFAYSDAIKDLGAKGGHWTYQNLGAFLWKPSAYAKGTKMSFPGFKKAEDRANVIAFLRTLSDSPPPLPSAAEIAAEAPKADDKAKATTPGTAVAGGKAAADATQGKNNPALKPNTAAPAKADAGKSDNSAASKGETAQPKKTDNSSAPQGTAPANTTANVKPADEDKGPTAAPASAEKK